MSKLKGTPTADSIDNREAALQAAERKLRVAQTALAEMVELLAEAQGKKAKRIPEIDANGEPTWNYAIKRGVPDDIYVTKKFAAYALAWEFTAEQAEVLMHGADPSSGSTYEGFIKYYQRVGTKWARWTLVWEKWVREQNERRKSKGNGSGPGVGTRYDRAAVR